MSILLSTVSIFTHAAPAKTTEFYFLVFFFAGLSDIRIINMLAIFFDRKTGPYFFGEIFFDG